ncbi:MAG: monovalent cation/H+ antiporter subunit D, partial [Halomonas sp.]
ITGLPPLSGFIAKFSLFHRLLNPTDLLIERGIVTWVVIALVVLSGLAGIISLMRFGVRTFWAVQNPVAPHLQRSEVMPVITLLLACLLLTVQAGPTMAYLERSTEALNQSEVYLNRLGSTAAVGGTFGESDQ